MTSSRTSTSRRVDKGAWITLQTRDLDDCYKTFDEEGTRRRRYELVLLTVCFLAAIYTYPGRHPHPANTIDIPALSVKIPVRHATALFPTIIAACHLITVMAAIRQGELTWRMEANRHALLMVKNGGDIPQKMPCPPQGYEAALRRVVLPTPLHTLSPGGTPVSHVVENLVAIFVGSIFILVPFAVTVLVTARGWQLTTNPWWLAWNLACISIMLFAQAGAIEKFWHLWRRDGRRHRRSFTPEEDSGCDTRRETSEAEQLPPADPEGADAPSGSAEA